MTISGFPNIRVIIREAEDENLTLDVPNILVKVEKDSDYNVNVTPASVVPMRTGSYQRFADVALFAYTASYVSGSDFALSSSYAATASYAFNGFPFSGSAVITGSLLITSSVSGPSLTVYGSDIYVRGVRIGAGPNGAINAENNIVFGNDALEQLTTGVYNTAIGHEALRSNTVGTDNTAIGYHALSSSFSGSSNVGVGAFSLNRNTTGSRNVAIGPATMYYNRTGVSNTAVGAFAQLHNESGSYNTSIGVQSFEYAHGDSNTMIGAQAGRYVTGSNNTYIGRYIGSGSGLDLRSGSNFIVFSDGESNVRQYYDGVRDTWVWVTDNLETLELNTALLQVNVPVVATEFTGSLYGTASVVDGGLY
jgi:hypothetical protein